MNRLIAGYRRFHTHVFPQKRRRYRNLASGQNPLALFITCCDSRVQPTDYTGAQPGDLFVERSLGNIVPGPGDREVQTDAIIEYAVIALKVKHVIVCGHSNCGAMKGLLDPSLLAEMPLVAEWLTHAAETRDRVDRKFSHLEGDALLDATVRENVLVQVERVHRIPFVAERVQTGELKVHGWVFEIEHGQVLEFDPRRDAFVELPEAHSPLPA